MQVHVDGEPLPPLRSRKSFWLLALLLIRSGRPVEREWLASMLWPDSDHARGLASLRTVLSELRKALGPEGGRLNSADRYTVSFRIEGADVDLQKFEESIAEGSLLSLELAVSLYTGSLLEGCGEEWAFQERIAREQSCLQALLKLGEGAHSQGDYKGAAKWLRRAIHLDPWWDAARRALMEALSADGDVNEALQVYRSFDSLLRSESSAVPDEQTTNLYLRLRAKARSPRKVEAEPERPQRTEGYVPTPLTALIGREDERDELVALLRRSRLLTLTGVGGIGKTRLAIAVAEEIADFPEGAWFLALDSLDNENLIAPRLGALLGLPESQETHWQQAVVNHLRPRRLLLILDNCEHLIQACSRLAGHLLQECPAVKILATSRETLGITGERVWSVPSLPVPDPAHLPSGPTTLVRVVGSYEGVQLFVERASAANRAFKLDGVNARKIAEICHRLQGVPLAIELVAARLSAFSADQIAERLHDHLSNLDGSRPTTPIRHGALGSTLDWSMNLLSEAERCLLLRVSVFVGGWSLEAAEAVCSGDGVNAADVAPLLRALVEKSLVVFDAPIPRYRLLEMVRHYAVEQLGDAAFVWRSRLQGWLARRAEQSDAELRGPNQSAWVSIIQADIDNFRSVLDACASTPGLAQDGLHLAGSLARFWYIRGDLREGRRFLERALNVPGAGARTAQRARALHGISTLTFRLADYGLARQQVEEALSIRVEQGDLVGVGDSTLMLANTLFGQGDYSAAESTYERARALADSVGNLNNKALILGNLASINYSRGDYAIAKRRYREALDLWRGLGNQFQSAWALQNLGFLSVNTAEFEEGRAFLEEALESFRELGERRGIAWTLSKLGNIANDTGDNVAARSYMEESNSYFQLLEDRHGIGCITRDLGLVNQDLGELKEAREQFSKSLEIHGEIGFTCGQVLALKDLAMLDWLQGDEAQAREFGRRALELAVRTDDLPGKILAIETLALIILSGAAVEVGARIWGAVISAREQAGLIVCPRETRQFERTLRAAESTLGSDRYALALAEGRKMTIVEAIELTVTVTQ